MLRTMKTNQMIMDLQNMTDKKRKIKVKKKKADPIDNTIKKQLNSVPEQLQGKNFKPGVSGNPKGRPKGSRNKLGEAFLSDFLAEWEEGGAEALKRVRTFDPATFIKVAASILPREIKLDSDNVTLEKFLEQFQTIEEIDEFIRGITALGNSESNAEEEAALEVRSQSDAIH
jgi:hypothetical protein